MMEAGKAQAERKQSENRKRIGIIAFTENGCVLGAKLLDGFRKENCEVYGFVKSKYVQLSKEHPFETVTGSLKAWAKEWIPRLDGIIFFGATGIAVRTMAPFVVSKKTDPAVVVIDEQGNYAISLLSGHLGGANELTRQAAVMIGALPVITTGTDVNHTFAVDVFARKNHLVISSMELAKDLAALLIRGKTIVWGAGEEFVYPDGQTVPGALHYQKKESPNGKQGTLWFEVPDPGEDTGKETRKEIAKETDEDNLHNEGSDIKQYVRQKSADRDLGGRSRCEKETCRILHLYPKNICLGVGCKKNTPEEQIEKQILKYLKTAGISIHQICQVASIDLKKEEPGLLAFCEKYQLPFVTYSGEELSRAEGTFTSSAFVSSITGVDNVCERSASLASDGGNFIMRKQAAEGVTAACTIKKWSVNFE